MVTPGLGTGILGWLPTPQSTGPRRRRHAVARGQTRWLLAAALVGFGVVLFLCYVRLSGTFLVGSDGASNSLEARDMLHGNWLLRGWVLTDVSFYTTELPEYAAVELARGLNPGVVHVASAITYTLLVLLAGLLAKGRAGGREGRLVSANREALLRALIAAGIMLAPQLGNGIHVLLSQPDHIGTQVPILVVFLILDRAPRRWYTPTAIGVLLALIVVADEIAIVDAAVPLAAAGALRALWAVARRRERLASQWFELSLVAAAVAATAAGELTVRVISRLGGFGLMPVESGLAPRSQLPVHLWLTVQGAANLFGADVVGSPPGAQTVIAWLHMIGVALALAGLCVAIRGFFRSPELLPGVLALGIIVNLVIYVPSVIPDDLFDTREIAALLPFGAVLAGRLLAAPLLRARLVPALAVAAACYVAALGYGMAQPQASNPEQALVGWLEAHHLSTGLGTFTEDNVTTLDSGGRVRLLTVSWLPSGGVPRAYQSTISWYDPRTHHANFVLTSTADGWTDLIPRAEILALAGPPAHTYHFQTFTIMVWNKNLLADLGSPPSINPGDIGHS